MWGLGSFRRVLVALAAITCVLVAPEAAAAESSLPGLTVSDVTIVEGDAGAQNVSFVVRVSRPSTVQFTVVYGTEPGTATHLVDYSDAGGTFVFLPGEVSKVMTAVVHGDTQDEPDAETFRLRLRDPVNVAIDDGVGEAKIFDNDGEPTLQLSHSTVAEGDSGAAIARVTARLSHPVANSVTARVYDADVSTDPRDYQLLTSDLRFAPGETSQTVDVLVLGDHQYEGLAPCLVACLRVEQMDLVVRHAKGAVARGRGRVYIVDDDVTPLPVASEDTERTLAIGDALVHEGDVGTQTVMVAVRLDRRSASPVRVNWATLEDTATSPQHFVGGSGTSEFAPGEIVKYVAVVVNGNAALERADYGFGIVLSGAVGATLTDGSGRVTIRDNDEIAQLRTAPVTLVEGDAGVTSVLIAVNLSRPPVETIRFTYRTVDELATAGTDYSVASGIVEFAAGNPRAFVNIDVHGDTLSESPESVLLEFTELSTTALPGAPRRQRALTIIDN